MWITGGPVDTDVAADANLELVFRSYGDFCCSKFYPAEVEGLKVKRIMDGEVNLQIAHVVYRETYNIKKYVDVK